jgi:glycopeptide antibiotics resistance protein
MRKEDFWRAVLWSAGIVAACELAQTFIYSRYAASTDVLVSTLGAAIGAYAAIRATSCQSVEMTESTAKRRDVFWIAIAGFFVLYAAFLCVVYWGPFEVLEDPVRIERRLRNFLSVPFAKLYWGTEYNAVTQMLGKFFSFMPFGIAAAVGLRRLSLRSRGVWWIATTLIVLAFAAFGCAMELVQAIFPPHLPDITDAMFYTSGTLGGLLLGRYVLGDGRPTPI